MQYKREELFSLSKYVDDLDNVSLMCCKDCCSKIDMQTYTMTFHDSGATKFLDMNRRFVRTKSGRPRPLTRPAMKNDDVFEGTANTWKTSAAAPRWKPHTPRMLASVFQGYVVRFRHLSIRNTDWYGWAGRVTAEFVLRGYRLRDLRHAWALCPSSLEKLEMLHELQMLKRQRLRTEGINFFPGSMSNDRSFCSEMQGSILRSTNPQKKREAQCS